MAKKRAAKMTEVLPKEAPNRITFWYCTVCMRDNIAGSSDIRMGEKIQCHSCGARYSADAEDPGFGT